MSDHPSHATPDLARAFEHLANYRTGSSRGGLEPIDEAVRNALGDATLRTHLEARLVAQLARSTSAEATSYICDQLRLIGSSASVPALAALLGQSGVGDVARGTLEMLGSAEAAAALRQALPRLGGTARIGVIHSLGRCQDADNVAVLAGLLKDADAAVAAAAAAALGSLGTLPAAQALEGVVGDLPSERKLSFAHACLDCAAGLTRTGDRDGARRLYQRLLGSDWPEVIVKAARHAQEQLDTRSAGLRYGVIEG